MKNPKKIVKDMISKNKNLSAWETKSLFTKGGTLVGKMQCPNCKAPLQYNKFEDKAYCTKGCGAYNYVELQELQK